MTRPCNCLLAAIAIGLAPTQAAGDPMGVTSGTMMQTCRIHAGKAFHARLPDIETKYEGQRTDGTHAVNGTAIFRGRTETFQCSFDRPGKRIVRFIVNRR